MQIEKISIVNFKNFAQAELNLSAKINCFVGLNGVGKTNLLDAIYYLSFTKSYFNHIDTQNIRHSEDFFVIQGTYNVNDIKEEIYCGLKRNKNKVFKHNKKEYEKFSEHIGFLPAIMITPYDNSLILEGSEERRKLIDSIISQYDKLYLHNLIMYKRILNQRNTLLKQFFEKHYFDYSSLEIWDEQLIEIGNEIHQKRKEFLVEFLPIFQKYYNFISDKKENVSLKYQSQLNETEFKTLLFENLEKDKTLQYTSVGIHKDDLTFKLDNFALKKNGSQGQQKTFLISLKLAQFDFIKNTKKIKPILLLDDIFDKLDNNRVEQIIKLVSDDNFGQIFITHTNLEVMESILRKINIDFSIFEINDETVNKLIINESIN